MAEPDPSAPGVLRALVLWPALFAGYAIHRTHLAITGATAVHRRLALRPTEYAHLRSFLRHLRRRTMGRDADRRVPLLPRQIPGVLAGIGAAGRLVGPGGLVR